MPAAQEASLLRPTRVASAPEHGPAHQHADSERDAAKEHERYRQRAEKLLRSDVKIGIIEARVAGLRSQDEGEATEGAHRAERHRERRQAEPRDEDAVQRAERRAGRDDDRDREPDRGGGGEFREQHRAEGERRGERDVDLVEDDDDGEADGENAGVDELAGRTEDLVEAEIIRRQSGRPRRGDEGEDDQRQLPLRQSATHAALLTRRRRTRSDLRIRVAMTTSAVAAATIATPWMNMRQNSGTPSRTRPLSMMASTTAPSA